MLATTLRTLGESFLAAEQRTIRELIDCSQSQASVLLRIAQASTIGMRTLARQTGLEKTALTRITDALEARGWISKQPDPVDARALVLVTSPNGLQIARQLGERLDAAALALIGGLAPADRAAAERILNRLCALLDTDARVAKAELE